MLSLYACDNELEIGSNYKKCLVIYGLLNLKDSTQYIRVQESYYSKDDGMFAAGIIDSICPKPEDIEIYMEVLNNEEVIDGPIYLEYVENYPKDSGLFANSRNLVYRFKQALIPHYTYRLHVYDKTSGIRAIGTTDLLGGRNYLYSYCESRYYMSTYYPVENIENYQFFDYFSNIEGQVKRFLYKEFINEKEYLRYVDCKPFQDLKTAGNSPVNDSMGCQFSDTYLQFLAEHIPIIEGVTREIVGVDQIVTLPDKNVDFYFSNCNNDDLFHYLEDFSNIENGQGLFASKYYLTFFAQRLFPATIDSVAYGRFTGHLGFKGYYDTEKYKD